MVNKEIVVVKPDDEGLLNQTCQICKKEIEIDEMVIIRRGRARKGIFIQASHLNCAEERFINQNDSVDYEINKLMEFTEDLGMDD